MQLQCLAQAGMSHRFSPLTGITQGKKSPLSKNKQCLGACFLPQAGPLVHGIKLLKKFGSGLGPES